MAHNPKSQENMAKIDKTAKRDGRTKQPKKKLNKEELLQARKEAYKLYLYDGNGKISNNRIALDTGLTIEQVKKYREKDKWELRKQKDIENGVLDEKVKDELEKINYTPESVDEIDQMQKILDESGLRDQQKLFIMFYLQSYNVSWAAKQAGYSKHSAGVRGNTVLKDEVVKKTINKIKALMHENIYIRTHDIIDEYVKIAFADMTEFVEFDQHSVRLRSSDQVDGRMITEVKQGRDGVTIKTADKMKALERLEKLFEIMPDKRLELEEKKFALVEKQANLANTEGKNVTIINDIR